MGIVVQKFGGTSVANIDRIRNVANIIKAEIAIGNKVAVVVSAMAGVTDTLVNFARDIVSTQPNFNRREYDVVLASGEIASAGLLALALDSMGIQAQSFQAWQIPIRTNKMHNEAKIEDIDASSLQAVLEKNIVPIICGFQGIYENSITTLGRGGSDTTAAAIAAALRADICDIFTDVDGIYSIDPNKYSGSRKIEHLSYDEVIEMSYSGAKVLHPRSAEIAKKYNIPIRVRSSFKTEDLGTLINDKGDIMENAKVLAVTVKKDQSLFKVTGAPLNVVLRDLSEINFNLENSEIANDGTEQVVVAIANDDVQFAQNKFSQNTESITNLSKISITGHGIKHSKDMLEKVFEIVSESGIKVVRVCVSDLSLGLYVNDCNPQLAQKLHDVLVAGN